jgi:tripartite ATP-independent transporter DctM subunit
MSSLPLWASGCIGAGIFFILMFLRMHVGMSLMIAGFFGFAMTRGFDAGFSVMSSTIYEVATSPYLVVIPLFVVMGTIAAAGGPIDSAFTTFNKWIGHFRGGLSMAAVCSCAAFGAVCGDNIATAMIMDKAALPQMRKYGYKDTLSLGSIAAGGNLGIMIPPSAAFVVYGFITETRIDKLFLAGILPGIMLTVMFCIQIYIQTRLQPYLCEVAPRSTWKERFKSLTGLLSIIVGFLVVMIGLLLAWFTPQEAGGLGAIVMVLVSLPYLLIKNSPYPRLTWKSLYRALLEAVKVASMILVLIFGARYFSYFLTSSDIAAKISDAVVNSGLNRYLVMILVAVLYLILGCLMDIWSVMIITLPIFYPVLVQQMGFDALQLGVITVLCIMIGCITPPVGVVVFTLAGVHREVPMYTIFRGVGWFVLTMTILLFVLIFVPEISTFLPGLTN